MMSTSILLFYGTLILLLSALGTHCLPCFSSICSKEELCPFTKSEKKTTNECRFVLALDENCSFKGAMGGSLNETEIYLKGLSGLNSSEPLNVVRYGTYVKSVSPAHIVSDNTVHIQSLKWKLVDHVAVMSGCADQSTQILCTLLANPRQYPVNKTMCPDPTTTTMVPSSTVVRTTVFLRGHRLAQTVTDSEIYFARTTSGTLEFTTSEESDVGIPIWAYAVGVVLFLLVIAGCVLGYFAWKRKWFQKKAKPAPPKKAEGKVILRPHNEFPDLMPDSVWKQMGPLRMLKNQKGPLVHKLDGVKSEPLKGPIQFDYANMEIYDIGEGVEILTGESSTLSLGPLPKSDTVHGGPPDVSVAGTTDVSVATQKSKKKDQLPVNITQKELKGDKKPEETHPNNPKKSNQLKVEQTQEE